MAVGDVEQEDTDFESVLCPEIPAAAPPCLRDEIYGLRCFIMCNTLCTFALTEWLELTDLKKNYQWLTEVTSDYNTALLKL